MDQPGDEVPVVQQFLCSGETWTKIVHPSGSTESGVMFTPASAVGEAVSGLSEGQGPRKERISSDMSESESTDTNYSEDYTRMTEIIGEGSDLENTQYSRA